MSLSTDQLLTWLLVYGYPALFAIVLIGSLGLPVPTNLVVLAAGGFVAEGELDLATVLGLVFVAAIAGDCLVYVVARWAGEKAVTRHGARFGLGRARLAAVHGRFGGWMGLSVFVTRCLLTPLALPATIMAAISGYSAPGFVVAAVAGEILWTAAFVGLGYVFGGSWSSIVGTVQDSIGLVAGLGVAVIAMIALVALVRPRRALAREAA